MQFQESHLPLLVLYHFPLISLQKIKSSLPFCTWDGRHQEEDYRKLQKTAEPMVPIRQQELQLKTKVEIPAHCDTQVRKIEEDIKISNKKFKARNIASCLSKWKEITSDKCVLSTISGENIDFEDITQIPLTQRKPQKHERDSNIFRQIKNLL